MESTAKNRTQSSRKTKAIRLCCIALVPVLISMVGVSLVQTNFGHVNVKEMYWETEAGIGISATLYVPDNASVENPAPAVVSLAGPRLRKLRYVAHQEFNKLYQSGLMSKRDAYQWLAMTVQAPMAHAHIGHLGEYYCQVVIDESRKLLQERLEQQNKLRKVSGGA